MIEARSLEARGDVSAEELQGRLRAAEQIRSVDAHDDAYVVIALDAAASGQAKLCIEALDAIRTINLADQTAASSSRFLCEDGDFDSGLKVAQTIKSVGLRDAVLAVIANGDYSVETM